MTETLPPRVKRTTIVVRDIAISRAFYRDVLGFKVWYDREFVFSGKGFPNTKAGDACHLVIMEAQDPEIGKIGLLQYTDPPIAPAPLPTMIGIGGVIFVGDVDDVDRLHRDLVAAGARIATPPHLFEVTGADGLVKRMNRVCFFDPDGVFFEINGPPILPEAAG
jgi:catechol 2,3-dioxygenase-like lactoylglutathione lyase family enzyme